VTRGDISAEDLKEKQVCQSFSWSSLCSETNLIIMQLALTSLCCHVFFLLFELSLICHELILVVSIDGCLCGVCISTHNILCLTQAKAMQDPEIQGILSDPIMQQASIVWT